MLERETVQSSVVMGVGATVESDSDGRPEKTIARLITKTKLFNTDANVLVPHPPLTVNFVSKVTTFVHTTRFPLQESLLARSRKTDVSLSRCIVVGTLYSTWWVTIFCRRREVVPTFAPLKHATVPLQKRILASSMSHCSVRTKASSRCNPQRDP